MSLFESGSLFADSVLEPVRLDRDGRRLPTVAGCYDPQELELYLDAGTDVVPGDVVTLRGVARYVVEVPERWLGAGVVVKLSDEVAFPDAGTLIRLTGGGWDYQANATPADVPTPVWSGPCTVTPVEQGSDGTEVAEQMVTTQTFTVETPTALVDVRPDDLFVVSKSGDPRLVGRRLTVTRVEADSHGAARVFIALDNQG